MNPGEKDLLAKKESEFPRISSRQWCSSFKNPRIVRVSRTFGGKDRHSKVCTVRGLRDRRIRLSVPTAIQLYDLQHKLGLTQPSKVVDWLIDAAKHEIDKLPPLPMIPSHLLPTSHQPDDTYKWNSIDEGFGGSAQNLFPLPYNNNPNFFHWDPSSLSLSQFRGAYNNNSQPQEYSTYNFTPSPYIPQPENDYFVHQNSVFPTTLHLISRKQDNKD